MRLLPPPRFLVVSLLGMTFWEKEELLKTLCGLFVFFVPSWFNWAGAGSGFAFSYAVTSRASRIKYWVGGGSSIQNPASGER
jgi:hypothetical protein